MKPSYKLKVNGQDITPQLSGCLISLTLTDERSSKADQLDITLDDTSGKLAIPPRNAELEVWLGMGEKLSYKGKFTLDEATHSGPPDIITLRARSADFKGSLKIKREQSWHETTLGELLTTIAQRNGLNPMIGDDHTATVIGHLDQTNESDLNLINRLGEKYDAIATVKNGYLLFTSKGTGKTVSGTTIPTITIDRNECDQHNYTQTDRDSNFTGVQANWHDTDKAELQSYVAGHKGTVKKLRHTYANEQEATTAADKHWLYLQRQGAKLTLNVAKGNPLLYPETPVKVQGFKSDINNTPWITERVVHSLNDNGYLCRLELEVLGISG